MSQFTPGPWRVGKYGPNGCYTVGTEKGLMTAMIAHSVNEPGQKDQAIGDANLVAAAPDLLEALELSMKWLNNFHPDFESVSQWNEDVETMQAAIKKARGES